MRKTVVFSLLVILGMVLVSCIKPVPLKVKTPVISPAGGTYTQAQNVTITCEIPDTEIRYTLDGSEPSKSSTLYTGVVNISSSATLTAKAFKPNWTDSDTVSQTYTITGKVTTPVVNPVGGTYTQTQNVTITCVTPGAEIRYTLDETEPSTSSTLYTGAINISSSATLTAKAYKPNWTDSDTVSQAYTLKVQSPVMNPVGGTYTDAQNVTITCETSGAEIRYTLDGSEPSTSSTLYTGAINIPSSKTLKAKAFKLNWTDSDTVSQAYIFLMQLKLSKCFGGTGTDYLNNVIQTNDGGYLAVGYTNSNNGDIPVNHGQYDGWITKVDSNGNKVWSKTFGGSDYDCFYSIIQTSDGGYLAVGHTLSFDGDISGNYAGSDGWIIKIDSNGNIEWSICFGGSKSDFLYSVIQTSDGGYLAVGYTSSNDGDISDNHGALDGWLIKIDANGNTEWSKCFGGSNIESFYNIIQTSDGGYLAVGYTDSNDGDISGNHGGHDGWMLKINETGNKVWSKCFGGSNNDIFYSAIQTSYNGYIGVGETFSQNGDISNNHGYIDGWILKVDATGNKQSSNCFGGSSNDTLKSIIINSENEYVAVGSTNSNVGDISDNHGYIDGWMLKVDATVTKLESKCLGGTGLDRLDNIILSTDGSYITVGHAASNDGDISGNHGDSDGWIVKIK